MLRRRDCRLGFWSDANGAAETAMLNEISVSAARLARLDLTLPKLAAISKDGPGWRKAWVSLCAVAGGGVTCQGLACDAALGVLCSRLSQGWIPRLARVSAA